MKLVVIAIAVSSLAVIGCAQSDVVEHPPDPGEPGFNIDMGFGGGFVGPQPTFGPTVSATTPPPPLSGGTLVMLHDGKTALAADPDRDRAYLVDLVNAKLSSTVTLTAGDEPGRAVEDGAGKLHLVLRRAGAVATIDPATAMVTERKAVCAAPRGIAYEAATDRVHVACAGGELVSLPAAGGDAVRTVALERDLRDVAVVGAQLWVSTFRTAQVIVVNGDGTVAKRLVLPNDFSNFMGGTSPSVAWRMLSLPDGHVGIAHQRGSMGPVQTTQGGYGGPGGGCGGIVQSAVSLVDGTTQAISSLGIGNVVLPVDLSYAPNAQVIAVLSAGNAHTAELGQVSLMALGEIVVPPPPDMGGGGVDLGPVGGGGGGCLVNNSGIAVDGEATALAFDASETLWVQTREPATLQQFSTNDFSRKAIVSLSTDSRADTGWAVFHSNSGASIACASCHPEGGEDARVWKFDALGPRRTQSLRGHVGGTEPFHWGGELPNFDSLVGEVYMRRMAGPLLAPDQKQVLFSWINAIPSLPASPAADAAAVARGKTLFEDTTHAACTSCHSGPELTNNSDADVGTGGKFQVPRLIGVSWRAPFLHDGCAATLTDRFTSCGGTTDLHGATSQMTAAQIADLVAYLQTL
jgi:mono/diheme cytochrome c family protein